jgi:transposase
MAGALSCDLRSRVLAAVDAGMSRRSAAERVGVGIATAIRWVRAWRDEGRRTALPMGGDVRSHRIEAFRDVILQAVEGQKDITLAELADMLRRDHGASFADSTVWRFLDRHDVTFKKNGTRQRAGAARRARAAPGMVRRAA